MTHPIVDERTEWIHRCALRLGRLRPELDVVQAYMLADDLWQDTATMPPDLAAVQLARSGQRGSGAAT